MSVELLDEFPEKLREELPVEILKELPMKFVDSEEFPVVLELRRGNWKPEKLQQELVQEFPVELLDEFPVNLLARGSRVRTSREIPTGAPQ